ncbi:hypothetical protein [Actinomadura sp. B10D3]|uniref:hypothetical protein n=1 Tax=Actinomadura sp. B10D3 TaxID=3153557 RepID=UPI00325D23E0
MTNNERPPETGRVPPTATGDPGNEDAHPWIVDDTDEPAAGEPGQPPAAQDEGRSGGAGGREQGEVWWNGMPVTPRRDPSPASSGTPMDAPPGTDPSPPFGTAPSAPPGTAPNAPAGGRQGAWFVDDGTGEDDLYLDGPLEYTDHTDYTGLGDQGPAGAVRRGRGIPMPRPGLPAVVTVLVACLAALLVISSGAWHPQLP